MIIPLLTLTSCEGYRCGDGMVPDKITHKPFDSVFCEVLPARNQYIHSTGKFDLCNQFSGCVPQCKDISIQFSKAGYKTLSIENPENAAIYLER